MNKIDSIEFNGPYNINGIIEVPGDKSISHRSVILSSLTNDVINIDNFLLSQDCIRSLDIMQKLGVNYTLNENKLVIKGCGIKEFKEPDDVLYVGNSGTTIRLLTGLLSACDFFSVLSGDRSINNRPMDRIIIPLNRMGAKVFGRENNTKAPLVIFGNNDLKGCKLILDISSAQVKSCLLLAGLFASGETEINQPLVSRDHTERMLEYFGAKIEYDGKNTKIKPSKLKGKDIFIPGDFSSASFFIVAALILDNSEILVKNVGINPTRSYLLTLLKEMGGNIEQYNVREINNEPVADLKICSSELHAVEIDKKFIPNIIDEIPILCVAAAFASGNTVIRGAEELRVKESDRISSMVKEFNKLGIKSKENEDGIIIYGNRNYELLSADIDSYGDHRIAMALSIAALKAKQKININGSECINTSFPEFEKILFSLISKH